MRRPVVRLRRDPARRWVLPVALGAIALLAAVVWLGNAVARRTPAASVSAGDAPRLAYDDAYQAAFRSDGGAALVTVDAVYEHAGLAAALAAYPQRGFVQTQVATQLANLGANDTTLVFAVTLTVPPGYTGSDGFTLGGFRPERSATLTDDRDRTYPVRSWTDLADPTGADARTGLLSFERTVDGRTPESAGASLLRLELTGVPGGARTYTWNLALLRA